MKETLAKRLKECRKEQNLTQNQVAIYCDITEKAYQNYELMTREPKLEILIRIASLYNTSLDYLVGRKDEKNVVIMSLEKWNELQKTARNAEYLNGIDRSMQQINQGKVVVKTMEELEAMANE